MSRSYKKNPVCVYNLGDSKGVKRIFNRKLRCNGLENYRAKGIHKKMNRSWMIHEFKDYCSYNNYLNYLCDDKKIKSEEKYRNAQRNEWMKKYVRK